ncbi:MAG: hypothetical protein NC215_01825 [Ruminococcus sp.]|nr:hypothetical protein [Ruminococcus sp.]
MRINTTEYRQWKRRQNEKNLIRRSKRKKRKRNAQTAQNNYNRKSKKLSSFNSKTRQYEFRAPLDFSIIDNPEETISFFNDIISFIVDKRNFGKSLFIDISNVSTLSIDALMYLLAVVNNLNSNFQNKYTFSGNAPSNYEVRKLFSESGFYQFVKYQGTDPLIKNENTLQIVSGEDCDIVIAKRLSDFVCEKANVNKRACSFLYNMVIELMSNTHRHAYPLDTTVLHSRWYCFAKYDGNQKISFSFMDTGAGIPATVKKNFAEKIDILRLKGEYTYVVSALKGDFRTSTKKDYRGKGLPKICEFAQEKKIENLHIITNRANVVVYEDSCQSKDVSFPLRGTLYYWQIDISTL